MLERVARTLEDLGIDAALIGASALAVYGYARSTRDVDLGTATDPFGELRQAERVLRAEFGEGVNLVLPDAEDPLGGVLTVRGEDFDPVQIVNFINPLGMGVNPGIEAVQEARTGLLEGSRIRVVDLPHLIALKLFSGGYKSRLDVLELLNRNPDTPLEPIREVCERFGLLAAWERILGERSE